MDVLTGISVVEVIFDVAGDVLSLLVHCPMCICFGVVPNENSKEHNHSKLEEEADDRQAGAHIGALILAEEAVPHGGDSLSSQTLALL